MPARLLFALLVLAVSASPALAANARQPYRNVDPRVDAGNDTGDAYVEELNRSQLDRNVYGYGRAPGPYYAPPAYPPGSYAPAPGYYEPSPYYYAPPPYWR